MNFEFSYLRKLLIHLYYIWQLSSYSLSPPNRSSQLTGSESKVLIDETRFMKSMLSGPQLMSGWPSIMTRMMVVPEPANPPTKITGSFSEGSHIGSASSGFVLLL